MYNNIYSILLKLYVNFQKVLIQALEEYRKKKRERQEALERGETLENGDEGAEADQEQILHFFKEELVINFFSSSCMFKSRIRTNQV